MIDPPTAKLNIRFEKNPIEKIDFLAERQAKALNMSKNTKVVKVYYKSMHE